MRRRVLQLLSVLVLIAALSGTSIGTAAGQPPAQSKKWKVTPITGGEAIAATKAPTSALAKSDKALLNRTDTKQVNVVVKFDYDSVAAYTGGVRGLRATSPEVTGKTLRQNRAAVAAYRGYLGRAESRITSAIRDRIAPARITNSFKIVYGGVAMRLPANRARDLLRVPGVVAVQRDRLAQLLTDATPEFIGATEAWNQISGPATSGAGVIVGVLDTGTWPEHPSWNDPGVDHPGGTFGCEFGDGNDPALGDPFECNDKLIGAYAFVDTYMALIGAEEGEFCSNATGQCSARDSDGHGTHTSSTAAGAPVDQVDIFDIPKPPISGMAPGAHVIAYRVCLNLGCFQSDSVAAVEQALLDGVDVINFSISGGENAYTDPVELAFLDAYAGGINVNASAGNEGPGPGTAHHAGPWTTTVGASTSDRHWLTTLRIRAANGETFDATGATITPGITPTPVVFATEVGGDELCSEPLPDGAAAGRVVICSRGVIGRVMKSFNVFAGDAAGMILYNPTQLNLHTDNFWVPTVMLEGPSPANEFLAFMNSHTGETATWDTGTATKVRGDVMTQFSSRGPVGDFIKPDVTAPGLQILAGHTPQPSPVVQPDVGPPGEFFQSIAGTSMSSPHSAGVTALVKAAHPDWTPGQVKSALMTSSIQDVLKEDGATPSDPFDRGSGSIRANRAIDPTVTFDVPAADYIASATDPLGRVHLNLPSINVPTLGGELTTTRTMTNVSDVRKHMAATVQAPPDASITVSPNEFELEPGASQTVTITISAPTAEEGQHFGQITFEGRSGERLGDRATDAVVPVAFNRVASTETPVALDNSCDPTAIPLDVSTDCRVTVQNNSPSSANANLVVTAEEGLSIHSVSPPGVPAGNGFTWSGTLEASVPPQIVSITEGGAPSDYLPLSGFGVPPIPGVGDETITNLDTPEFLYGSETYSRLGMVSNGYTVIGGGSQSDVSFVPSPLPDPAGPNNTVAPFWTDLDPSLGGALRAAVLEDSVTGEAWIVQDWEDVATFGNAADVHDFQIWTQIGDTEGNHLVYGDVGVGSSDGVNAGAENRDGSSGVELDTLPPPDNSQWTINTAPPEPGGSVTITYKALAVRVGVWDIIAELTSDITVGTITDVVSISVARR
jgi:Subtilase family/Fibronectin type-III domain/PA domain